MPEILVENKGQEGSKEEQTPDQKEALRAELEAQYQAKEQEWQSKFESLEKKFEENDLNWKRFTTQQGQELGRYRQLFESNKNQEEKRPKKKRHIPDEVDPITNQDGFNNAWKANLEMIEELNERTEKLSQQLGKLSEFDQLKDEMKKLQTQVFVSSEEKELRDEYGLTDRDFKKLRAFSEEAGLPSLKAGLFYVPEIKEKILNREQKAQGQKKAPNGIGQDLAKATEQHTSARGGKKSDPAEGDWLMELEAALKPGGDFDSWPPEKRSQAKARLATLNQNGEVSMFK